MRDVDLKFGLILILYFLFLLSSYNGRGPVTSGSVIIVSNAVQLSMKTLLTVVIAGQLQ